MNYPYRTDGEQAALEHLLATPYSSDDQPYLSVARYSIVGYEPREVEYKAAIDKQGIADNIWWTRYNHQDNRAVNFGQR